jgi:uncharacterized protein (TIGR00251 family)
MKNLEDRKFNLHHGKAGAAIAVRVTPRMSKNEIYEILDNGTVKIRLTAPPVDGKANAALAEFLAKILNVPIGNIEIVAGITGRDKLITILNMTSDQVQKKILENLK